MDKTDIQKMHDNLAFLKIAIEVHGKGPTRTWVQNAAYIAQHHGCKCLNHLKFYRNGASMHSPELQGALDQALRSKLVFSAGLRINQRHIDYNRLQVHEQLCYTILTQLKGLSTSDINLLAVMISMTETLNITHAAALEETLKLLPVRVISNEHKNRLLKLLQTLRKEKSNKEEYGRTRALEVQYGPGLNISSNLEALVGWISDSEIVNNEYTRLCWIFDETETKDLKVALTSLEQSQFPIEIAVLKVVVKLEYFNKKDI